MNSFHFTHWPKLTQKATYWDLNMYLIQVEVFSVHSQTCLECLPGAKVTGTRAEEDAPFPVRFHFLLFC